ncbi:MAG: excalibur calcium-binding domain-containing protein [Acidiferrobacterales bacterium]|nr:excalibur calcium-binding domain-containing protein [Acidiferrobacterales bacterium]
MQVSVVDVKAETWRGLAVAPEYRCSPYNSRDYHYPQSVEPEIINSIGKIYSPYTGNCFSNRRQTDIEHIVARSEAHDSGMCSATKETKSRFARDLLNLTLASPQVNRSQKVAKDAADWIPELNQCWFAATVVAVKRKYKLTVDKREAVALEKILSNCESTEMTVRACRSIVSPTRSSNTTGGTVDVGDALAQWDDNSNGRITCKEATRHGIAPVTSDHPAYRFMRDGDGDGVVCE